jgi:putative MFS transporter
VATSPSPVTRYHRRLLVAIAASTFFEGFDQAILALVAPYVAREFALDARELGLMLSFIGIGAVLALAITMQADRYGRRRLLLVTVAGYGLATGLTALARGPIDFVLLQLLSRIFLIAELAIAVVVVAEEFPAHRRGMAISLLVTAHVAGGVVAAFALGPVMGSAFGWRAMYALGLVPLLLVIALRFGVRETERFTSMDLARGAHPAAVSLFPVWREPYRRPLVLCIMLFGLIGALVITFPSFYAYFLVNERGFTPAQVSRTYGLALTTGLDAIPLAGWLLDRWGRRAIGVLGPILGAVGLPIAFNASGSPLAITLAGMAGVFVGTFILPMQMAYMPELFPTRLRALAASWISNGVGRILTIGAPSVVGFLAGIFGSVGLAASTMSACGIAAAVLVYCAMPETKGLSLEETARDAGQDRFGVR